MNTVGARDVPQHIPKCPSCGSANVVPKDKTSFPFKVDLGRSSSTPESRSPVNKAANRRRPPAHFLCKTCDHEWDAYLCGRCGQPKKGHICRANLVVGPVGAHPYYPGGGLLGPDLAGYPVAFPPPSMPHPYLQVPHPSLAQLHHAQSIAQSLAVMQQPQPHPNLLQHMQPQPMAMQYAAQAPMHMPCAAQPPVQMQHAPVGMEPAQHVPPSESVPAPQPMAPPPAQMQHAPMQYYMPAAPQPMAQYPAQMQHAPMQYYMPAAPQPMAQPPAQMQHAPMQYYVPAAPQPMAQPPAQMQHVPHYMPEPAPEG